MKYGNPFADDSPSELVHVETRNVVETEITKSIYKIESCGANQASAFMQERVIKKTMMVD